MRIDKNLNLIVPVDTAMGVAYIHSAPIARVVFEQFYDVLGRVFTTCFDGQDPKHIALTAPQLALPALKRAAGKDWEAVRTGLVNEIARLTNVSYVGASGWEQVPFDVAVKRGVLDDDTEAEAMSALVFFTSISKVAPRELAGTFLEMAASLRDWQFSSLDSTAYMNSLPMLTATDSSTVSASQVIS